MERDSQNLKGPFQSSNTEKASSTRYAQFVIYSHIRTCHLPISSIYLHLNKTIGPYVRRWSHCLQSLLTATGFCDFTPTSQLIKIEKDTISGGTS